MASDQRLEVYKQHRAAQEKYTYFLLAAAGAAIAFAVNQTQEAKLSYAHVPLALAVLSWALSFFFGCKHLRYVESIIYSNAELLRVQSGEHPMVGSNPQLISAASEGITAAMETNSNRSARFADWQFRCLVIGAISYIVWHLILMWLRT